MLMRWAMAKWERIAFLNRYLGGTVAPRVEMDLLPGLLCGAHFAIVARTQPAGIDDRLAAGGAVQRFWLSATQRRPAACSRSTPRSSSRSTPARAGGSRRWLRRSSGPMPWRSRSTGSLAAPRSEPSFSVASAPGPPAASRSTRLPLALARLASCLTGRSDRRWSNLPSRRRTHVQVFSALAACDDGSGRDRANRRSSGKAYRLPRRSEVGAASVTQPFDRSTVRLPSGEI